MKTKLLRKGDIIELKGDHTVYHNGRVLNLKSKKALVGTYVVDRVSYDGGGTGHGPHDVYPNGHHVWCV